MKPAIQHIREVKEPHLRNYLLEMVEKYPFKPMTLVSTLRTAIYLAISHDKTPDGLNFWMSIIPSNTLKINEGRYKKSNTPL